MQNLKLGSRGDAVKSLQQYLQNQGLYNGAIDGIYGPKTFNGVQQLQQQGGLKVDGIAGPQTFGYINSHQGITSHAQNQMQDPNVSSAVANDPIASDVINQLSSGNFGGLRDAQGRPYDPNMVKSLFDQSFGELNPAYQMEQDKGRQDIESQLGLAQRDYQRYLDNSAAQFGQDKNQLDTNAAQNGVLFSTGRTQNENSLANKYASADQAKRDTLSAQMGDATRDYEYKFGQGAIGSLGNYTKLKGANAYNANVAKGVVTPGSLSNIYNTGGFYGTNPRQQKYEAAVRAAGKLYPYTNQRSLNSYNNQY